MKRGRIGFIVLGIWLILQGLPKFIDFHIDGTITAVVAIAAGILILIDR